MSDLVKNLKKFLDLAKSSGSLKKAREDQMVDPSARREFRQEKRHFGGTDPLEGQITTAPGVSDVGIEARRGDARQKGAVSHGYGRVSDPSKHKDLAVKIHRALHGELKSQPKPDLPKTQKSSAVISAPMKKKEKVLIRPDVVSKPETFNEDGKSVSRPTSLSGPVSVNVRKADVAKGSMAPSDEHDEANMADYVNHDLALSDKQETLYHIKDGPMRITKEPMSLKDITAKHGPVQKLESSGFRLVPHVPKPPSTGNVLRRSS